MDPVWLLHSVELRSFVIDAVIETMDPLRVGSGKKEVGGELGIQMVNGIPVIPGSTLKGVFRSTTERLASSNGLYVCRPVPPQESCLGKIESDIKGKNVSPAEKLKLLWEKTCIACKVFGGVSYLSHVFFSDAYAMQPFTTIVRPHIAISRQSGSVNNLFEVEAVGVGTRFSFSVIGKNLPNYATWLILAVLRELDEGRVKIGGFKSRGYGRVRIVWDRTRVRFFGNYGTPLDDMDTEVKVGVNREYSGDEAKNLISLFEPAWTNYVNKARAGGK